MTIISHLLIYILGLVTAFIISIWVHRQHKKAWQLEYRRLMGGIFTAVHDLRGWCHVVTDKDRADPPSIYKALQKVYNNEPTWPRK